LEVELSNRRRLYGKTAIVTGGASGIGKEICQEFVAEGAAVVIADIDAGEAEQARRAISQQGGDVHAMKVDVCDFQQTLEVAAKTFDRLGSIDILVNSAGWNEFRAVEKYQLEQWNRIRSVNLDGAWHCCKAVMPYMIRQRHGKILNIGSAASILGIPKSAPYCIAKHGLVGLTRALAVDLARYNLNVNCICPASIDTPLLREATKPIFVEKMVERIPLGCLGKPSDIAKAALFLASSDSDWITGVVLPVDGGLTCCIRAHHYE
jgi:3-oxoacyl-[acyl-carrier protein] reductase